MVAPDVAVIPGDVFVTRRFCPLPDPPPRSLRSLGREILVHAGRAHYGVSECEILQEGCATDTRQVSATPDTRQVSATGRLDGGVLVHHTFVRNGG